MKKLNDEKIKKIVSEHEIDIIGILLIDGLGDKIQSSSWLLKK